jgi:hypothetical protein
MNKLVLAVLVLIAAATQAVAQQPPKPNVGFILADNVGYGDLGSYGDGELRGAPTPRLDELAQSGLRAPQSLPTAHGFDEFYGIPPDINWDAARYPAIIALTHSVNGPYETLLKTGPQIVEAKAGGPLQTVKPFTEEVLYSPRTMPF